jgi:hypothetical protein
VIQLVEAPPKRRGRPPKAKPVEVKEVVENPDDCPVVRIIEREYYLKETGETLKLEPHQRRIINAAFALDERGKQRYRTLVYSAPKKSGKTEIGSALTYAFLRLYGGQCYSIANDQEQASSRMFQRVVETLELMREKDPHLYLKVIHPDYAEKIFKGRVIRFSPADQINPGPHELAYIPNDFRGEAGGMPALTMWDELWGYSSSSSERLWTEMQPVPTLPVSMRIVTTYAGFYGESHLLYSIYESLVDPDPHTEEPRGNRVTGLEDLPCFEKGSYFCYWDHEARMPWHTLEFMEEARSDPSLNGREQEYERIWRNRWITGLDAFIPMDIVNARMEEGEGLELINHLAA